MANILTIARTERYLYPDFDLRCETYARYCAAQVLHMFPVPHVVREFVERGAEDKRAEALAALDAKESALIADHEADYGCLCAIEAVRHTLEKRGVEAAMWAHSAAENALSAQVAAIVGALCGGEQYSDSDLSNAWRTADVAMYRVAGIAQRNFLARVFNKSHID